MLVQLSGVPGSGKSLLARGLAERRGLVVLDTDVVKSALLEAGVPVGSAGPATYGVVLAQAGDLLAQGHDVAIDSPCRYRALLDGGRRIAAEADVRYAFVELWATDTATLLPRLDLRTARPSQVASATSPVPGTAWENGTPEATLAAWQDQLVRPEHDWLRLDALAPQQANLAAAISYLDGAAQT